MSCHPVRTTQKQQILLHIEERASLLQEDRAADFQHYPDCSSEKHMQDWITKFTSDTLIAIIWSVGPSIMYRYELHFHSGFYLFAA